MVPAVNLLSPWVLEEIKVRELRGRFIYAAVIVLAVVAMVWSYERIELRSAQSELEATQTRTAVLERDIDRLAPVRSYVEGVNAQAADVQQIMRAEVSFAQALEAMRRATPAGITLDSVSVSLLSGGAVAEGAETVTDAAAELVVTDPDDPTRGLSGAGCPGPDPFATTVSIGCLTISGTALDRESVGRLVTGLAAKDAFDEPFIATTTTEEEKTVTFSGTVGITPAVFTGRYDDLAVRLGLEEKSK